MSINIDRLTRDELVELYGRISTALDACESRVAAASVARLQASDPAVDAVVPELRSHRYFNPINRAVTWNGRGRCPNWFKVAMAQGRTPEELAGIRQG